MIEYAGRAAVYLQALVQHQLVGCPVMLRVGSMMEVSSLFSTWGHDSTDKTLGGCCPSNYVCGNNGCTPSAGVSVTETCGTDSYLCPASVNYGCCKTGMGCGLSSCYSTAIVSYTLTETLTITDANSNPKTITKIIATASTPVVPTAVVTLESGVIPKASSAPSAIPKTKASGTSSGGGLTAPQLGGIIGGAVAILLVVLIVAVIIVKKLNKAIEVAATSKASSSGKRSGRSHPRPLDVDAMSVDPLMMTPSEVSETPQVPSVPSHASVAPSSAHEADSSPIWRSPFSPRSPPHTNYPHGYNAVASSDSAYSASSSGNRNPSLESSPPLHHNPNAGYFDIPPESYHDYRSPTSHISASSQRRPSQHARNWSNASDQSAVSQSSSQMAELEAGADGGRRSGADDDRRSGVQRVMQGISLGRILSRRLSRRQSEPIPRSQQPPVLTGGPQRADWSPPAAMGGGALGHIPEAGESRIGLEMQQVDVGTTGLGNAQLREVSLLEQQQNAAEMREGQRYG